jgi:cell division protein FtsB
MADMMDPSRVHWTASYENTDEGDYMSYLEKLKQQATDVASTVAEKTQEAAKVGQLHVQLRNLRGDERDALNEFGREAYNLQEAGALAERSGELAGAAAKIADLRAQIAAKEQEIADMRSGGEGDTPASDTVESSAEEVSDPASGEAAPAAGEAAPADEAAGPADTP